MEKGSRMSNIVLFPGSEGLEYFSLERLIAIETVFDEGDLVTRSIDKTNVAALVACELKGVPPIEIVQTNRGPVVIDGYHRWQAATQLQHESLIGIARTYPSERAVIDAAFRANLKHGKQANGKTRTAYAFWLWVNDENMNPDEAAKKAGISPSALYRHIKREDARLNGNEPQQKRPSDYTKTFVASYNNFFENKNGNYEAMSRSLAAQFRNSSTNIETLVSISDMFRRAASLVQAKKG